MVMKKSYTIPAKLLLSLVFAMAIVPNTAKGQNVIYDFAPQTSEFSVIRHYKNDIDITYSWYLSDENCFCYVDRQNNVYYKADVGLNLKVTDFRIYNNQVFFCGIYGNSSAIGWFDIVGLFFGGDDINIVSMPVNLHIEDSICSGYDVEVRGSRLKVFEKNNALHIVMVGWGQHVAGSKDDVPDVQGRPYAYNYSAIIDMWTSDYFQWNMRYTMDYEDDVSYDDIAVTKNYVVVTSHFKNPNHNYLGPQILYYPLPTSIGQSIFDPISSNSSINVPGYSTDYNFIHCQYGSPLLIAEMVGDTFATVCDAVIMNIHPATVVTYYKDPVSSPIMRLVYNPNIAEMTYSEVRYNEIDRFLYLFRFHTRILERVGPPFSNAILYKAAETFYCGMSMDVMEKKGAAVVTASSLSAIKELWRFDAGAPGECMTSVTVSLKTEEEVRYGTSKLQYIYGNQYGTRVLPVDVSEQEMNIICY